MKTWSIPDSAFAFRSRARHSSARAWKAGAGPGTHHDDIDRAKARPSVLTAITEGAVTPVVITSRLDQAQSAQAEEAGVTTFGIPYP